MFSLKRFDFSNHTVLMRNRKPSRTHFVPFSDEISAKTCCINKSNRITMLNGQWDFKWFSTPFDVTKEVMDSQCGFEKIEVPLNWQYAGYGKFIYTDLWYPFPVDPPFIPAENETGVYKRQFTVTENMIQDLSIRFEGVESAFHLYINGEMVGYSQGSRMPSEFNITNHVKIGDNTVCVVVYQFCDGTYLEDQDMLWLGGIIRAVYLIERKNEHIENLILDPDFDIISAEGILNVMPLVSSNCTVNIKVLQGDELKTEFENVAVNQKSVLKIPNTLPWTAETPNLYTVLALVYDQKGNVCEVVSQKIGFRHIEIKEGTLLLNGQRILMKGVNRHEYNSKKGRAVTFEDTYADFILMKQAGMNAVRTSHYPNNPFTYEICNELGLYVMDECDLETHGFEIVEQPARLCSDPEWEQAYIDRVERMVERDRNYACVIMWSLGNESYFGDNFRAMYHWCKQNEPTRPIHYQEDFKNELMDVSSTMYSTVGRLKEIDTQVSPKRPHIHCEFAHAMGNGPGSLKEYFEVSENSERIQGIFIWELRDHGVYKKREDGKVEYKFGGEFGEKFHNGNFCLDGLLMSDNTPTPGFYEYKKVIENAHIILFDKSTMSAKIKNRFDFLTFDDVKMFCTITSDNQVTEKFEVSLPKFMPHDVKIVSLERELKNYICNQLVTLDIDFVLDTDTAWCKKGEIIGTHREVLCDYESLKIENISPAQAIMKDHRIYVSGNDFAFYISLVDARIYDYYKNSKLLIQKGPILNYYRAYTDNDVINREEWNKNHLHSMSMTVYSADIVNTENTTNITIKGRFAPQAMAWGTNVTITYKISSDGYVKVQFMGDFDGKFPSELPKIGTTMQLPKELSQVTFCGFGDGECYCDSKENAKYGIYSMDYNKMQTPYPCPQENGNRTGVKWALLCDKEAGISIGSTVAKDFSARDVEDEQLNSCTHNCDLKAEDYLSVNYDMINSGLGSGACGPKAMDQYKAFPIRFDFSFSIVPVTMQSNVIENARKTLDYGKTVE
ncbi:MAG: glycoside hydrolase family 2 TIM barrel-domain containing protein [Oscillospiraceae bacterium]